MNKYEAIAVKMLDVMRYHEINSWEELNNMNEDLGHVGVKTSPLTRSTMNLWPKYVKYIGFVHSGITGGGFTGVFDVKTKLDIEAMVKVMTGGDHE